MALICKHGAIREDVQPKALHRLMATPETVHWGYFSPEINPALTVQSGDLIQAQAVTHHAGDDPALMFDENIRRIFTEIDPATRAPGCHIMTGPIHVEGAEPGDMLEVRYFQMTPRFNYGSNLQANWGHLYKEFGETERVTIYKLDPNANTASALYAYDIPDTYLVPGRMFYDTNSYDPIFTAYMATEIAPGHVFTGTDYPYDIMQRDPAAYISSVAVSSDLRRDLALGAATRFLAET